MADFVRPQAKVLRKRLTEARRFIQVITGPRQSGKTTLVRGVGESTAERIVAGRPWSGGEDLVRRAGVNQAQLETLAAMDSDYDIAEASASIRRLREMRDRGEARLWISHAPEDWVEYPHQME